MLYNSIKDTSRSAEFQKKYGPGVIGVVLISKDAWLKHPLTQSDKDFWDGKDVSNEHKELISKALDNLVADATEWAENRRQILELEYKKETYDRFIKVKKRWEVYGMLSKSGKYAIIEIVFPSDSRFGEWLEDMSQQLHPPRCYSIPIIRNKIIYTPNTYSGCDIEKITDYINTALAKLEYSYIHGV